MDFFKKHFKGDPNIWAIIIGLSVFSLLAVYSSTGTLAYKWSGGNTATYIIRHGIFLFVGLFAAFIIHKFPYKYYARLSQILILFIPVLLLITLLAGVDENDATRRLSILGMTFQTSDLAKLVLIMFLAQRLASRQNQILNFKETLLPMFILIGVICALILPANFSTAALLFLTSVVLLFVGRASFKQLSGLCAITLVLVLLLVGGLYGLQKAGVNNVITQRASTWVNRVERFFSDEQEENADLVENYQPLQAKIAVGTSGFFGKGPGNSVQRNFLPHPYSDFIFAIIIEEWGILGGMLVLFLYLNLLYRTVLIVRKCDKTFPAFLAIGLAFSIVFQAMINMMVAVGLIPVTGQPLPLISMGGTSILFTGITFGIILGISREVREQEERKLRQEARASVSGDIDPVPQAI
ncbi:MAG: FtsW/RodA/SpoVE family cell cycle protein [Bacteroidales bacterium]|jgi:cell division protein FtsW|nr:FtsW/RodA/SpoVE family cell cycle protein [Bacteroidales bacterium]